MQSILILVYILIPLTNGVRNYQNSMIGMYNSGVPKVPNSHNIYELYGKKKGRHIVYQKVKEEESPRDASVENQNLATPQSLSAYFDLRRQNSANTEPPKPNLDFPIPGGQMGEYNPYPTLLRRPVPDMGEGVDIDSPDSFAQYFPAPPIPQGRVENDFSIQGTGEKDMLFLGREENGVPIVQPKIDSSPPIERAVPEEYNVEMGYNGGSNGFNGGSNGFNGGNNGHNGENNYYDLDMNEFNKVIEALAPTEKTWALVGTSLDEGLKQNELLEQYNRITNTLNGKVIEKGPLGYIGGSNGLEKVSVGYNGFNQVSNGFNGGLNGFEGSNGAKPDRQGYNIQYSGMKAKNKEYNEDNIEYNNDVPAYTKRDKALPFLKKSWTSKSLNINPEEQELVEKYKRILDLLNIQTL